MTEELKRGFGYWTALALAIGSILGTTIFFGIPLVAEHSGNLLIVAWLILTLVAIYVASIFGELTAMFPKAGGAYEFSKQAYGKFPSFILAWIAWMFGSISVALITIAAVNSLNIVFSEIDIFGVSIGQNVQVFMLSVVLIIILSAIAFLGVEASSFMLLVMGAIMVGIPLAIIAKGLFSLNLGNFTPFATHPFSGVFITLFFMAEAYFGWEAATCLAEETKNPAKNLPKALIMASVIVGIIGFLMIIVTLGTFSLSELESIADSQGALTTELSERFYGEQFSWLFGLGVFLALIGTAAATIISMPRLLLAMARDRLFPGQFKKINSRFKTPGNAIIFQAVVLVFLTLIGLANYKTLLEILVPMGAFLYVALILAVVLLRKKMPYKERPFKVRFIKLGSVITILFFVSITAFWLLEPGSFSALQTSVLLVVLGIPMYLLVEFYYDPKMITSANDVLAYVSFFSQRIFNPNKRIIDSILYFLGNDIKGKVVLDYGCGLGDLSFRLAKEVGPSGKVYGTHFSKNHVKIATKIFESKRINEDEVFGDIRIIHDPFQMSRIHPELTYADAITSIGMLGYVQNLEKVLKEMYFTLPMGGKIFFVERTNFFHMLPDVEWLSSDSEIEALFRKIGFDVRIKRVKGILWNTIFIQGIKYSGKDVFI